PPPRHRTKTQAHLPLPEPGTREPAVGEVLAVLLGGTDGLAGAAGLAAADRTASGPEVADVVTARIGGHHASGGRAEDDRPGADRPGGGLAPGEHDHARAAGGM